MTQRYAKHWSTVSSVMCLLVILKLNNSLIMRQLSNLLIDNYLGKLLGMSVSVSKVTG
jgi:hypothetical protein